VKRYTDLDFVRLIDEVEAQGGRHLPERCMADEIEYDMPDGSVRHTLGNGCEEDTLFAVAYDGNATVEVEEPILVPDKRPGAPKGRRRQDIDENGTGRWQLVLHEGDADSGGVAERSTVHVCANDDLLRMWPRFRHVIHDGDPLLGTR
jgi:hypothetical protein